MGDLDIPDEAWDASTTGDLRVGDLCARVPLAVLARGRLDCFYDLDEQETAFEEFPLRRFVPFHYSFAVVIGRVADHAVVAGVGTVRNLPAEIYTYLVETGRSTRAHIRLPPIPDDPDDVWGSMDGIAFLSLLESFPTEGLSALRVATMTDEARGILQQRITRAASFHE